MPAAAFLRLTGLTVLATLGLVAGLNVVVDPYDLWGSPKITGLNVMKPALHTHLTDAKRRQYARLAPRSVLAGNSRVEVGIDPQSAVWSPRELPAYNFGLPGVRIDGVVQALAAVGADHPPARVYLGVDFIDFSVDQATWTAFRPQPLRRDDGALERQFKRVTTATLSLDALVDSVHTLVEQRARNPETTRVDGFTPLDNYNDLVADEGHAAIFAQRSLENARAALKRPKAVAWPTPGNSLPWRLLGDYVQAARGQGIEVVLFTYPYHAELLETFRQTGQWPAFEDWMRRLTALAADHQVPLWNFVGFNAWTTEAVPPPGDHRTRMRWYWEAGHFKAALGDEMIRRMHGDTDPSLLPGAPLTPATVAAALQALEQDGAAWRVRDPAVARRVTAYAARAAKAE